MKFNQLTDKQEELLYILAEELCEAGQAIGKILRHGYENGWNGSNNRVDLENELGHVIYAIGALVSSGELQQHYIDSFAYQKSVNIKPFLHHQ